MPNRLRNDTSSPHANLLPHSDTRSYWQRKGGYIAGRGYMAANAVWIAAGIASGSHENIAAGIINFMGGKLRSRLSDDTVRGIANFGSKAGASAGILSNLVSTLPGILKLDPMFLASNAIILAAQTVDVQNDRLTHKFSKSRSFWLRETFGKARRLAGGVRGLSRLPLIAANVATQNYIGAAVFVTLLAADLVYASSKPNLAAWKAAAVEVTPLVSHQAREQVRRADFFQLRDARMNRRYYKIRRTPRAAGYLALHPVRRSQDGTFKKQYDRFLVG